MSKKIYYFERILAIISAIILLQTLYYKFTGHEDSVYIFSTIGIEPYGRIGLGVIELITAVLLLYPRTAAFGAFIGVCIMMGAILTHFFILGTEVRNDGGTLFIMAVVVFISSVIILIIRREQFYILFERLFERD